MKIEGNLLTASEGKVLQRISDKFQVGKSIYLGYTYYLHDELLDTPLLELPEHYEEVDEPEDEHPGEHDGEYVDFDELEEPDGDEPNNIE